MPGVFRVTAVWTGFQGAPGYSKFSFRDTIDDVGRNAAGAAVRQFFDSIKLYLPGGTTITVQPQVDELDLVSGELIGAGTMTTVPTAMVSGTAAAAFAGGSGLCITWLAGGVFAGRRIRGRTFIVPAVGAFDNDGTISTAAVTAVTAAGNALIATAAADFAIWNRQYNEATPPVAIAGSLSSATSCTVRDVASQLRSRRL
jgi:hypothetical protein